MPTLDILEVHAALASEDQWKEHDRWRAGIEAAFQKYRDSLGDLLLQHPGKVVVVQDDQIIVGESSEELHGRIDPKRPYYMGPIRPRESKP